MSSANASVAAGPRARQSFNCVHVAAILFVTLLAGTPLHGAPLGKTYFYATRQACVAAGAFSARECASAFANAQAQFRDRAPRFASSGECGLRYRLCEMSESRGESHDAAAYAQAEDLYYVPAGLGIEMIVTARGVEAAPTLAIETRERLFSFQPISGPYEPEMPERPAQENASILSADRFQPFSKLKPFTGATTFQAAALGAIENATRETRASETPEQRRARPRSAPFVE